MTCATSALRTPIPHARRKGIALTPIGGPGCVPIDPIIATSSKPATRAGASRTAPAPSKLRWGERCVRARRKGGQFWTPIDTAMRRRRATAKRPSTSSSAPPPASSSFGHACRLRRLLRLRPASTADQGSFWRAYEGVGSSGRRIRDPISRAAILDQFADDRVAAIAQTCDRRARGVRQPAGRGRQIANGRPLVSPSAWRRPRPACCPPAARRHRDAGTRQPRRRSWSTLQSLRAPPFKAFRAQPNNLDGVSGQPRPIHQM